MTNSSQYAKLILTNQKQKLAIPCKKIGYTVYVSRVTSCKNDLWIPCHTCFKAVLLNIWLVDVFPGFELDTPSIEVPISDTMGHLRKIQPTESYLFHYQRLYKLNFTLVSIILSKLKLCQQRFSMLEFHWRFSRGQYYRPLRILE